MQRYEYLSRIFKTVRCLPNNNYSFFLIPPKSAGFIMLMYFISSQKYTISIACTLVYIQDKTNFYFSHIPYFPAVFQTPNAQKEFLLAVF